MFSGVIGVLKEANTVKIQMDRNLNINAKVIIIQKPVC